MHPSILRRLGALELELQPVSDQGDKLTIRRLPLGKRQIPGSSAFVPGTAGLILAGEVVRDIAMAAPEA